MNAWVFAICGALLTLAVILNTINTNLNEQKTDMASLRSLGVYPREIVVSILTELLLITVIGVAAGVPLGREVGFQMAHSVDMEFYGLVALLQPLSVPLGVAAMMLMVVLASLPGLNSVFKVELGQVSKGQSL